MNSKKEVTQDLDKWERSSSFPILAKYFSGWLTQYSDVEYYEKNLNRDSSKSIYNLNNDYSVSVIEFISGMTDHFIMKVFEEMTRF
jgi:dGTP triphosphohydrolase